MQVTIFSEVLTSTIDGQITIDGQYHATILLDGQITDRQLFINNQVTANDYVRFIARRNAI